MPLKIHTYISIFFFLEEFLRRQIERDKRIMKMQEYFVSYYISNKYSIV